MEYVPEKSSFLKKVLGVLFALIILMCAALLINNDQIKKQPGSIQETISEKFHEIRNEIEFNGLTASVWDLTRDYSDLFDGFSNVIITDDNGYILFKVNDAYISEQNKFEVLVDPWESNGYSSDIAYLIDNKNKIKYTTHLDIYVNSGKLKEKSALNRKAKALFPQETDDIFESRDITGDTSETKIITNYEYIASRGFHLFTLYDSEHQYNKYYLLENSLRNTKHWLLIAVSVFGVLFWLLLPVWVFRDARRKHLKAALWTLIIFVFSLPGLGLYLVMRPGFVKCEYCGKSMERDWIVCPYCGKIPDPGIDNNNEHEQ